MENIFAITDPEKTLLISIQWNNDINENDKKKIHKMILSALELWEGKEKFAEDIEHTYDNQNNPS